MPIKKPYYPLTAIDTGLYTSGGEYQTELGENYVGPYHRYPNGDSWSEHYPMEHSIRLYPRKPLQVGYDAIYNVLTTIRTENYVSPTYSLPNPSDDDYNNGYFMRYFVQRRNNARSTSMSSIIEIDVDQYQGINYNNSPGIDGNVYMSLELKWTIAGDVENVVQQNKYSLSIAEVAFPGITLYLTNLTQFFKFVL